MCMYTCMCVCLQGIVLAHVFASVWRLENNLGCYSSGVIHFSLIQGLSPAWSSQCRLAGRKAPGTCLSLNLRNTGIINARATKLNFCCRGSRQSTCVLMLARQVLCCQSHPQSLAYLMSNMKYAMRKPDTELTLPPAAP